MIYDGAATDTIYGLSLFSSNVVNVMADGVYAGHATISQGRLPLAGVSVASASHVVIGFAYLSDVGLLPLEGGSPFGTAQGQMKRINHLGIRFYKTMDCELGWDDSTLITHTLDSGNFFTGDKKLPITSKYSRSDPLLLIRQQYPRPLTILALMPEQHVYE